MFTFVSILGALYATAVVVLGGGLIVWGAVDPTAPSVLSFAVGGLMLWYGAVSWRAILRWWRTVPEKRLLVMESGIEIPSGYFPFPDVEHVSVSYTVTRKRQNFMDAGEDHNVEATLYLTNGQRIEIGAGPGPTTWFGATLGREAAQNLMSKIDVIQQRTLKARAGRFTDALDSRGHFYFDGKRIDATGIVHFPDAALPLAQFWLDAKSPFELFSRSAHGKHLRTGKLCRLSLEQDRDAFFYVTQQRFGLSWPKRGGGAQKGGGTEPRAVGPAR